MQLRNNLLKSEGKAMVIVDEFAWTQYEISRFN